MASPTKKKAKSVVIPGASGNLTGSFHIPTHVPCNKDTVTAGDVIRLMLDAGFPADPDVLGTGTAVVFCESSNQRTAGNYCCHGIWAINLAANGVSLNQALNLCEATRIAHKLWAADGKSFEGPWAASSSCWHDAGPRAAETIRKGVGSGLFAHVNSSGTPTTGAAGSVAGALDWVQYLARLFEPAFWLRVGKGILGFALILYGASALSKALLGLDLAGPAEAFARALKSNNPTAETASTGDRVSSKVKSYRTRGSKVIENKTKVKPTQGGAFGDEPPF